MGVEPVGVSDHQNYPVFPFDHRRDDWVLSELSVRRLLRKILAAFLLKMRHADLFNDLRIGVGLGWDRKRLFFGDDDIIGIDPRWLARTRLLERLDLTGHRFGVKSRIRNGLR